MMSFLSVISQILKSVTLQSNKLLVTCNKVYVTYIRLCKYKLNNHVENKFLNNFHLNRIYIGTNCFSIDKNKILESYNNLFNFKFNKQTNFPVKINFFCNCQLNRYINTNCYYFDRNKNWIVSSVRNQYFSTTLQREQTTSGQSLLLVRFPNPVLWAKMKWRFRKLNYFWDPEFNEEEFIRGAKQAVVTITHLISENKFDDLQGLLTKEALQKLRQEVTLTWPDILKQHIALDHNNIKAVTPINIRMMANMRNEKRFCDVDILYIALKRIVYKEKRKLNRILVFNILSRFHRNYSDGEIPNWTVGIFTMDVVAHKSTW